jgi:hypothetical protein
MSTRSISPVVWFAAVLAVIAVVIWLLIDAGWPLGWWALGGFLLCHGWVHLFVAMPPPDKAAAAGRRIGLTAAETRALTLPLVAIATVGFMLAGFATIMASDMWGFLIVLSGLSSLALLTFFFSRQLILGIVIDVAMLAIVVTGFWTP